MWLTRVFLGIHFLETKRVGTNVTEIGLFVTDCFGDMVRVDVEQTRVTIAAENLLHSY